MEYYINYSDVKKVKNSGLRGNLRDMALYGLSAIQRITDYEKYLLKPRVQFLYIHHIFKDEEIKLEKLLKFLSKHHTFISHSEAQSRILSGNIDKSYISISSDDGFKNNLSAAKILEKYGVSACFFINPGIIEEKNYSKLKQYCNETLHFPPVEFLDWKEVEKIQSMGHEIGSHTMFHMRISNNPIESVKKDLKESFDLIKSKCGDVKHFAYPYGLFKDFTSEAKKAVFDTGYISCSTAQRGCHINHHTTIVENELCIRRDQVILDWNLNQILYFLIKNSKTATTSNNLFPY